MKFPAFFRTLLVGAIAIFLVALLGWGWLVSRSSLALLTGGVNYFPQAATYLPKQAPAIVSLLTNPDKLNALHQVTLPLKERRHDLLEWQQWEQDLASKIGLDYQHDLKPWLGDEITFAIASLDLPSSSQQKVQPGYILALATKNPKRAQECLRDFYQEKNNTTIETYKRANIIVADRNSSLWSSVLVGDFVLFANSPQLLREAINQAQAIDLNLQQSAAYQTALANVEQPQIGIGYFDVLGLSAWLDKSTVATYGDKQTLSFSLSVKGANLSAKTVLLNPSNAQVGKSFLDNPELQQIFNSLDFNRSNSTYIELRGSKSLLEDRIPLYKVTKLAIGSLFPHLKAIAIKNLARLDNATRFNIVFYLSQLTIFYS